MSYKTVSNFESTPDYYYQVRDEFRQVADVQFRQVLFVGKNFRIEKNFRKIPIRYPPNSPNKNNKIFRMVNEVQIN